MASSNRVVLLRRRDCHDGYMVVNAFSNRNELTTWLKDTNNVVLINEAGGKVIDEKSIRDDIDSSFQKGIPLRFCQRFVVAKHLSTSPPNDDTKKLLVRVVLPENSMEGMTVVPFDAAAGYAVSSDELKKVFKIESKDLSRVRVIDSIEFASKASTAGFQKGDILLKKPSGHKSELLFIPDGQTSSVVKPDWYVVARVINFADNSTTEDFDADFSKGGVVCNTKSTTRINRRTASRDSAHQFCINDNTKNPKMTKVSPAVEPTVDFLSGDQNGYIDDKEEVLATSRIETKSFPQSANARSAGSIATTSKFSKAKLFSPLRKVKTGSDKENASEMSSLPLLGKKKTCTSKFYRSGPRKSIVSSTKSAVTKLLSPLTKPMADRVYDKNTSPGNTVSELQNKIVGLEKELELERQKNHKLV